jgi:hypothetical protein
MNITNPRSIAWQLLSLTGKRAAMSGFAEGETHLQRRLHAEYRATPRVTPAFVLRVCGGRRLHELHLPRRAASRPQAEVITTATASTFSAAPATDRDPRERSRTGRLREDEEQK